MTHTLTHPPTIRSGRRTMDWLSKAYDYIFARRLRRTLPAKMMSDHLAKDVGFNRVSGLARHRAR